MARHRNAHQFPRAHRNRGHTTFVRRMRSTPNSAGAVPGIIRTSFHESDERPVLERLEFFPNGSGNRQRDERSDVFSQSFRRRIHADPDGAMDAVEVENERVREQFFFRTERRPLQVRRRVEHPRQRWPR